MKSCASKRDSWIVAHSWDRKDDKVKRTILEKRPHPFEYKRYTDMEIYWCEDSSLKRSQTICRDWDHVDRQLWIYKDIWNEAGFSSIGLDKNFLWPWLRLLFFSDFNSSTVFISDGIDRYHTALESLGNGLFTNKQCLVQFREHSLCSFLCGSLQIQMYFWWKKASILFLAVWPSPSLESVVETTVEPSHSWELGQISE